MKTLKSQKGIILFVTLVLLVIVTLIGVIAVNTSTVDIQILGFMRRATMALEGAEAGIEVSESVIETTISTGALPAATGAITALDAVNLPAEIMSGGYYNPDTLAGPDNVLGTADDAPDITMANLGGVGVNTDIDQLYGTLLAGGAIQFAMGYEGIGTGAAGGGGATLYQINSQGTR